MPCLRSQIQDEAMRLWNEGHLIVQIADQLHFDRATAKNAINIWYQDHAVSVLDGRTRRKRLALKQRHFNGSTGQVDGQPPDDGECHPH